MVLSTRKGSFSTPSVFLGLKISNFLSFEVLFKNETSLKLKHKNVFHSIFSASQVTVGTPDG